MKVLAAARCAAFAATIALTSIAVPARADTCDDIMTALSNKADELTKMDAKGGALCAGMGQLVGLMQAGRIVAQQCSRDDGVKNMDEMIKPMEEGIKDQCK